MSPCRYLPLFVLFLALTFSGAEAETVAATSRSNAPFATVSNGLVGPLVVDVPVNASRAAIDAAVSAALRQGAPNGWAASATHEFLVRNGLLRQGSSLTFNRPVVLRQGGRLALPELERVQSTRSRLGGGEITFTYENWSADDRNRVDQFVQLMYPVAKQVYGSPSSTISVRIVRDDTLRDSSMRLRNGIYNASTNEIRFNPTGDFRDDMYSLTHLILYAFHDDAMFAYDAWGEGFSWAATYVIFKRIHPDYDLGESFKTFYFLQLYELLNNPGIGNARFWPASFNQLVATHNAAVFPFTLYVFRSAMAAAAWAKVYVENNNFFRDFNTAYYQQFHPGLAGHTPMLKAIAAAVAPTVEGQGFHDWYRRQHILDTSITAGRHLWVWPMPQFDRADGAGSHIVLLIYHFVRDSAGNETPRAGAANLAYYSWDFAQDYFAEEGNQTTILGAGADAGVGAFSPGVFNVNGAQKINVQVAVGGLTRQVYWPYLVRGKESDPNDFFGVTLDAESGEVGVIVGSGQERKTSLSQGAFGLKVPMDGWNKTTIRVRDAAGHEVVRQVNTGFDFYAAIVQGPRPPAATFSRTFAAGAHMMSVPAYPTVSDHAALGIPANRLLLAHWDPILATGDDAYRYRIYPGTPALAPGIGYWLMLNQETTVSFEGNPIPQDRPHLIQLRAGWNQIGHPYLQAVPVASLSVVTDPTDPALPAIDFQRAVTQGLLAGTLWTHTPGQGLAPAERLEPWRGYWVRAEVDILLKVPAVASPGQNPPGALPPGNPIIGEVRSRAAEPADGWRFRLAARVADASGGLIMGASRAATDGYDPLFDALRPPDMGNYVRLSVRQPQWGRAAGDYAMDIRGLGAVAHTWEIDLETNLRNQNVHLSWPDLTRVPQNVRLMVTDLDGGHRRYLRTSSGFTLNSGETGRRRLRLQATIGSSQPLAISSILVTPTRGPRSVAAQFTLSADALVDAQIVSPAGRTLRDVTRGQVSRAGVNQLFWDGRGRSGTLLAPGIYLLQLTATTEDGQSVRAVHPVVLVR